ncbi:MAG: catalase, partial [Ignavibacteria bacterium]
IDCGNFPEWELGVQIVEEKDEFKFDFDLLDPTKLIPEELVPVRRIGKLTLNRNPDNFFAETEQVAFHPGHIVPGIDFTNDPLLQGRLFSYTDTQLSRLGSPNFHEIPINRSISPTHNNQRDGHMRQTINVGQTSYDPNTLNAGCPFQAKAVEGGFTSYAERIDAKKIRARSKSFFDHFSQAKLFFNSQSGPEKDHLTSALTFELGKVKTEVIRKRMIALLTQVDMDLAKTVASNLGMDVTKPEQPINHSIPADGNPKNFQPVFVKSAIDKSAALSMENTIKTSIKTRKIAMLATDGFEDASFNAMKNALQNAGAMPVIIASHLGSIKSKNGKVVKADESLLSTSSVLFDAVYISGGRESVNAFFECPETLDFIKQAFKHFKPIGINGEAIELFKAACSSKKPDNKSVESPSEEGISINKTPNDFIKQIAQHRFWNRKF